MPPQPAGFGHLAGRAARCIGVTLLAALPALADESARAAWSELPVPGGRRALMRAAGLDPSLEPWRAVMEVARRLYATPEGAALVPGVLAHLDAATTDPGQDEAAPLPLAPSLWEQVVFRRAVPSRELLAAILADRKATLLYRGLASLDDATLAFLSGEPETLALIRREHARPFSLFAGGFRVRAGLVAVPGGSDAAPLWQGVVGQSPTRPVAFLHALLRHDGGSLFFLFDTVSRLPAPAQRFALGASLDDARQQEKGFRRLAEAFRRADPFWAEGRAELTRPAVDPARVLLEAPVSPAGTLALPWRRGLWEQVFAETAAAGRSVDGALAVDAAFLVEQVAVPDDVKAQGRLALLQFAHRSFAGADASEDVLRALRGFALAPALLLSLERIGVNDPAVHAAAAKRARQLVGRPGSAAAAVALAQLQAALALVDRARFTRALDARAGQDLARSLIGLEPVPGPRYEGRIAAWLESELLPALGSTDGDSAEGVLAAALAGANAASPRLAWWKGRPLLVDVAAAERARFDAVRRRLEGNALDRVLDYCRSAASLAGAPATPEAWLAHAWVLEEAAQELTPVGLAASGNPEDPRGIAAALLRELGLRSETRGPVQALAQRALVAGESLLAEALVVLAYASHLGPADAALLRASQVARRHDFGLGTQGAEERERAPWALPAPAPGQPWRLRGSLLALDTVLAPLALRRASDDLPAAPAQALSEADRRAFAQMVALLNPSVLTDAERDEVAAALARGRARVAEGASDPQRAEALADPVSLSPHRRRMLAWLARREPTALDGFFSLAELYALGDPGAPRHAWGVPDVPLAGLLPRLPPPRPGEDFAGVRGRLPMRAPDLGLRVAAALAQHQLPAELAPALLSYAVQDLLDEATPMAGDDSEALARFARRLPDERIGGYVAALIASGFLQVGPEDTVAGASR